MTERPGSVRVVLVDDAGCELDQRGASETIDIGAWIGDHVDQARDFRATAGPRLGPATGNPIRRGTSEDVVAPVAVAPALALTDDVARVALAQPVGGLTIDPSPRSAARRAALGPRSWSAQLRTGWMCRRAATLRLRPSPSLNLTIIELVPVRAPWFRSRAFVQAGVPAIAALAERIRESAMVTQSAKTPTAIGKSTNCG